MSKHTFTINYTISCGDFSRNKTETLTVEHDNPLTAWQPAHGHCCELWRAAIELGRQHNQLSIFGWGRKPDNALVWL